MGGKNQLILAAAGSGKTTYLVDEAAKRDRESVLITTYTEANEAEIRKKFITRYGCVPEHVRIQTWFSFLIQHGVKPFQGGVLDRETTGLVLAQQMTAKGIPESDPCRYYSTRDGRIYSDKLSKLAVRCNQRSGGKVVERISLIFSQIFVDEVQDLAGYDLEILRELFGSRSRVLLVGDPRQVTYLTHHEQKYRQYREGRIREFIEEKCRGLDIEIDDTTLSASYRCNGRICLVSDRLYPDMNGTGSSQNEITGHDGIFLVADDNRDVYLDRFKEAVQLRYSKNRKVHPSRIVYNFGESKGMSFDRVVLYPTKDMVAWLGEDKKFLAFETRCKFYVALTRARYSVAIVCDHEMEPPPGVSRWP